MRSKIFIIISIMLIMAFDITPCFADNPVIQNIYTADPAPMVYNGTVYLYVGHDEDVGTDSKIIMKDWRCYSSVDMQNWTDHGVVLSVTSFKWAVQTQDANAGQVIYRNGKFYFYAPVQDTQNGGIAIGVAVSNSPTGPFTDALGKPLVTFSMTNFSGYATHGWRNLDPTVYIDDNGQAYLYWGNGGCYWAKLNSDMISLNGSVNYFQLTSAAFGPSYTEGPWLYKRSGLYYLAFSAGFPEAISYSTSASPTGPWTYRGVIMPVSSGNNGNHTGIIDYNGSSYIFYFKVGLPGGSNNRRSVCAEKFTYNADGTIPKVPMTTEGPPQVGTLNPYVSTEAETICWETGIETEKCSEGGMDVCNIENGDYIKVKGVNFGTGATSFDARVASAASGGNIELRLDSLTGKLVGTCAVSGTGGSQTWAAKSCTISGATGTHDLYLKFTGGSGSSLFNLNWWKFNSSSASPTSTPTPTPTPTRVSSPTSTPTRSSSPTLTPTPVKSVDIDHNGVVNMSDVILVAKAFNTVSGNVGFVDACDLNNDGAVNMADVIMIAAKFNTMV
ncbi:MAG: family 43 glycosylhydrolase [Bacillota bacterium]|nr:family 43 glycosylhydrolase [Bacillota bacterium]